MPHNIEKSGFRKGEYVGYANGVWRIRRRMGGGWSAFKQNGAGSVWARTLAEISAKIAA